MKILISLLTHSLVKQNKFRALLSNLILNHSRNLSTMSINTKTDNVEIVKRWDHIVWVDLEMSGLNIDKDHILEMACLITDKDLNIIAEGPDVVIKQSDSVLNGMDEWCQKHHTESGLVESVKNSRVDLTKAEDMMLEFIQKYCPPGKCPLAGNSIHVDRIFLNKYMQRFNTYLHYRIIDVSSIKELSFRWFSKEVNAMPNKKGSHRALDDIKESIEELKYYRRTIFKQH